MFPEGVCPLKLAKSTKRLLLKTILAGAALFSMTALAPAPAPAQSLIRDTEVERVLRAYLDPILVVAGLQPEAVHLYIVNDPSINAFVAEGQNMFLHTGLLMQLDVPNEVIGVMAHETGHM